MAPTNFAPPPPVAHTAASLAIPLPAHSQSNHNAAAVGAPSLVEAPDFYDGAVSAETLYVYLQTRLDAVDSQINDIFTRQQKTESVRASLREIQTLLSGLDEEHDAEAVAPELADVEIRARQEIEKIRAIDPKLAARVEEKLSAQGQIFYARDDHYSGDELKASREVLKNIGEDLEATAQLDMIKLQSLMSARQTAVGLATNLTAACDRSLESIVGNIGK